MPPGISVYPVRSMSGRSLDERRTVVIRPSSTITVVGPRACPVPSRASPAVIVSRSWAATGVRARAVIRTGARTVTHRGAGRVGLIVVLRWGRAMGHGREGVSVKPPTAVRQRYR